MLHTLYAFATSPVGAWVAFALNAVGVAGFLAYGVGQGHLVWLYLRRGPRRDRATWSGIADASLPVVTVQLPLYNEHLVAATLIDACAALDWPADRLEIQVLDDSTDETVAIVDERASHWRARGIDVRVVRRAVRTGFKAGALAHGASIARGEFHALFDADFQPHRDFLRRTMPWFAAPRVGAVQARWGHLNRTQSWLTRAQAMVIDSFFLVEQEARDRAGLFIRFNGSAGIWRAATVADAGGWQADTLSEDYDLCLRAQLAGWQMVYTRDVVAPGELPPTMHDYKVQQTRWARGRGQVIRKLLPTLLRADLTPLVKAHAVFDMLNILTVPSLLLVGLASPWLALALAHQPSLRPWALALGIAQLPLNGVLVPYFVWQALRPYARGFTAIVREGILSVPPFFALMMGLNLLMLVSAARGLRGGDVAFQRTAKYRALDGGRSRRARVTARLSPETWGEGVLAGYFAVTIALDAALGTWLYAPFHVLLAAGFGAMFGSTLLR
ncbi:MAG: glycosyltransferase [Gemmatimonadetes bacterium]|nr:glycosyltransferase [Gemmatimonadota bacterium]